MIVFVKPEDVRPGDLATAKFQDDHEVAKVDVEKREVWLIIEGGTYGPYSLDNYIYRRLQRRPR